MKICGFIATTLIDFPGRIAAAAFIEGCNFRCPFCHNPSLVVDTEGNRVIPQDDILAELGRRRGFLDGVMVSGGEPLIHPELIGFLEALRTSSLQIKIDTNGSRPEMLKTLLDRNLVDFISMDIKATPENYSRAAGVQVDPERIERSVSLIRNSGREHEFRTTMVPGIVSPGDIEAIAASLAGAERFVLQQFRPDVTLDPSMKSVPPYENSVIQEAAEMAGKYIPEVDVRGIQGSRSRLH